MQRLLLAVGLSTLLFCGLAYSQGQPFSQYVTGLPAATTPLGPGDKFYVLQGGISKAVSAPNVLSGGVVNSISNADGTLTNAYVYQPGNPGDVVVVRLIYQWPIFASGLGIGLVNSANHTNMLVASAAFRNEPY